MSKSKRTSTGTAAYTAGILVGMAAFPILALLWKAFPDLSTVWTALFVAFSLLTLRSLIGYLFPRSRKPADSQAAQH